MDDKNPYVGLLEIMGKEAAALQPSASGGCMTGTVKSVDPLTITCNGLDVDGDALFVNATLSATAQRIEGVMVTGETWALKKGDLVLVLPSADMQTYHVVCKLEAANA